MGLLRIIDISVALLPLCGCNNLQQCGIMASVIAPHTTCGESGGTCCAVFLWRWSCFGNLFEMRFSFEFLIGGCGSPCVGMYVGIYTMELNGCPLQIAHGTFQLLSLGLGVPL